MKLKLITFVIGTRPEAIKLSCLINIFKKDRNFKTRVIHTGQHKELVESVLAIFQIKPDITFSAMQESSNLSQSFSIILNCLDKDFKEISPDFVIVQGDTTTSFAGALAAYYNNIPVGHVEAGLRTNSLFEPYPEEGNRRLISQIANLHFAPTEKAFNVLKDSKISGEKYITGNTVIDSLKFIINKKHNLNYKNINLKDKKFILATIHRRENWGKPLLEIANALKTIVQTNKNIFLLIPLHPNKIVFEPLMEILENQPRVILVKSLNYIEFASVLNLSYLILTDSGGLQEEAPALDKPVLVLRNTTERSEGLDSGVLKLIGNKYENIVKETNKILNDKVLYEKMAMSENPFGDGNASVKIKEIIYDFLIG